MDYTVNMLFLHQLEEVSEVTDIHLYETKVRHILQILKVSQVTSVGKFVKVDDLILQELVDEESNDMATNESSNLTPPVKTMVLLKSIVCMFYISYFMFSALK